MILFFQGMLTCFLLTVMYFDLTRYIIPNWLVGTILLLYPCMLILSPAPPDWISALLVGLAAFSIGFVIFSLKIMGGGDIKLLTVCAMWTGFAMVGTFLLYTALAGGVLSLALWLARPGIALAVNRKSPPPALPRVLTVGAPVPYGIAIAAVFLAMVWMGMIPGLPLQ